MNVSISLETSRILCICAIFSNINIAWKDNVLLFKCILLQYVFFGFPQTSWHHFDKYHQVFHAYRILAHCAQYAYVIISAALQFWKKGILIVMHFMMPMIIDYIKSIYCDLYQKEETEIAREMCHPESALLHNSSRILNHYSPKCDRLVLFF